MTWLDGLRVAVDAPQHLVEAAAAFTHLEEHPLRVHAVDRIHSPNATRDREV